MGARLNGASLLVLVAVALAACSSPDRDVAPAGPQVQIAEGVAPGTGVEWTAMLYRTADGLVCTQFRWHGDPNRGDGGCGSGTAPFVTREPGHTTWVIGGSDDPAAVSAVVRFAVARPPVTVDLVEPSPGVTEGIRYYAASIAGGPDVIAIDIVDAAGTLLLSQPIDLPAPAGIPTPS